MSWNLDIFYYIQSYIKEKPFLDSLIVFVARHVPTILIALAVAMIVVRLIPRDVVAEMHKGKIARVIRIATSSLLAALVLFFRRYVFGIQTLPTKESDGWLGKMLGFYTAWVAEMLIRLKVHTRFLMDIFVSPLVTLFFVWVAKLFFGSLRPFEALRDIQPLFVYGGGDSFPSGHAAFFASLSVVFLYHFPRLGVVYTIFALAIGVARIASGIHFPYDIAAGYLLGIVVTLTVMYIHHRKFPKAFAETFL